MSYYATIESNIAGIPCQIGVTYFQRVRGSHSYNADSEADYYGGTECEFEVLDRKGYKAAWLERKLSDRDVERIEDEISNYFSY